MPFPDVHTALWTMPLCHCHQHWVFTVQRKALQWPFMSTPTLLLLICHLSLPVFELCTDLVLHLTPQWTYSWKQRERGSKEVKKKGRNRDSERKMREREGHRKRGGVQPENIIKARGKERPQNKRFMKDSLIIHEGVRPWRISSVLQPPSIPHDYSCTSSIYSPHNARSINKYMRLQLQLIQLIKVLIKAFDFGLLLLH